MLGDLGGERDDVQVGGGDAGEVVEVDGELGVYFGEGVARDAAGDGEFVVGFLCEGAFCGGEGGGGGEGGEGEGEEDEEGFDLHFGWIKGFFGEGKVKDSTAVKECIDR